MKKLLSGTGLLLLGLLLFALTCADTGCPHPIASVVPTADRVEVVIGNPKENTLVRKSIEVTGRTNVQDVILNYSVIDEAEVLIAAGYIAVQPSHFGEYHEFSTSISLEKEPTGAHGSLQIFHKSREDGTVSERAIVPLRFETE